MVRIATIVPAVGYADRKTVVSDHATPASGTYAWYFDNPLPKRQWPMKALTKVESAAGITQMMKGYTLNSVYALETTIDNDADYENVQKMLNYWEAHNTFLYLDIQNEWNVNLAKYGTYAAPTTLVQMRGKLADYSEDIMASEIKIKIKFYHMTVNRTT